MTSYFRTVRKVKGNLALYPFIVHICLCKLHIKGCYFSILNDGSSHNLIKIRCTLVQRVSERI